MFSSIARQKGFYVKTTTNLAKVIEKEIQVQRSSGKSNLSDYVDEAVSTILSIFYELEAFSDNLRYVINPNQPDNLREWTSEAIDLLAALTKLNRDEQLAHKLDSTSIKSRTEQAEKILKFIDSYANMVAEYKKILGDL